LETVVHKFVETQIQMAEMVETLHLAHSLQHMAEAVAEHTDNMHHNLLVDQLVAVADVTHTQLVAAVVAQVAQDVELGDKTKNILGECMQDMVHTHQQQMKVHQLVDTEWLDKILALNQQLVVKADKDFMD
jgi:hypothetical protein